jgi:hypothetical protein
MNNIEIDEKLEEIVTKLKIINSMSSNISQRVNELTREVKSDIKKLIINLATEGQANDSDLIQV